MNVLYLGEKNIGSLGIIHVIEESYPKSSIVLKNMDELLETTPAPSESYDIGIVDGKALESIQVHNIKKFSKAMNFPVLILSEISQKLPQHLNQIDNVRGIIERESNVDFFLNAINLVRGGGYCYSWNISSLKNESSELFDEEYYASLGLTRREMEILKMYADGATNKEISIKLSRSEKTISAHKSNILRKIGTKRLPVIRKN